MARAPPTGGPPEGTSFLAPQPLYEAAAPHPPRPPGQPDPILPSAGLEDTSGPLARPPTDDTTDARLRTEEERPSVLGELGLAPDAIEALVARGAVVAPVA